MKALSLVLLCIVQSATAQSLSDDIFNGGLETGITFQGTAGYPAALANATVEMHFGNYVATTATKSDGTYKLIVETRYFAPVTIVELFAFGHGADVAKVWASPLGPSDRLQTLGAGGTVAFADEPFLNLNPRTTALAGALRAYNGFAPITDKATFYKAARSYQFYTDDLTYALALVARGDQALPASAANTFAAVASLATSQQLYADEHSLANVNCSTTPTAPFCVVWTTLPTDPAIVPAYPWNDGRTYLFGELAFTSSLYSIRDMGGVARPFASTVDFWRPDGTFMTLDSALQPDGSYLLTLPGGATIGADDNYPTIPPYGQVHEHNELIAINARSVRGPGGQTEGHGFGTHRLTYPENPEITQPVVYTDTPDLPRYNLNDPLPPELAADVPTLAGHSFVLASPFAVPYSTGFEAPYGYDVYTFAASTGSTERQSKSYTFSVTGPASFSLDFGSSTTADVQFVNEEYPGIWRVTMHATLPSTEMFLDGLMMETVGAAALTAANVPGSYRTDVNGHSCGGPYGTLDLLVGNYCGFPPYFGWIFGAGGSVNKHQNNALWGEWQLAGGADAGRLLFANPGFAASPVAQIRGWEMVRSNGSNDSWMLENVTVTPDNVVNAPPVSFIPTPRLQHVTY